MMHRYWTGCKETYEVRALDVTNAGIPGKHSASSIQIQCSKAGLRPPTAPQVKKDIGSVKLKAKRFFSKNPEAQKEAELINCGCVSFRVPDMLDAELMAKEKPASLSDLQSMRLVWRMAQVALVEEIIEAVGKVDVQAYCEWLLAQNDAGGVQINDSLHIVGRSESQPDDGNQKREK